jgi:hypothetical protein
MFGAWDTALNKLGSKSLLQLRALDWVTDGKSFWTNSVF